MSLRLLFLAMVALAPVPSWAATYSTPNFLVTAPSDSIAKQVGEAAEEYRSDLAEHWLGRTLPDWSTRCRIIVESDSTGGSGWTSYRVARGRIMDAEIILRGRLDWILEFVLPHEMTHTIFVTALGRLIPRWADEGLAMMSEPETQQMRQRLAAAELLRGNDTPSVAQVMCLAEYPSDAQALHAFYAASYSLTEFLLAQGNESQLLRFVQDGQDNSDWEKAVQQHYDFDGLASLETAWKTWIAESPTQDTVARSRSSRNKDAAHVAMTGH